MVQQPTQPRLPLDGPKCFTDRWRFGWANWDGIINHRKRLVVLALVRADAIIVTHVSLYDVVEVPEPKAGEVIETLALQRADPGLCAAIDDMVGIVTLAFSV